MRKKLALMFIFIGLLMVCIGGISAKAQGVGDRNRPSGLSTYHIKGKIFLPDGKSAAGVTITVNGTEASNITARTDQEGYYDVSGLGSGNYNVTVNEPGYKPATESLSIVGDIRGQAFTVVFHLVSAGDTKPANPALSGVPKDAVVKFQKGMEKIASDPKVAIGFFDEAIALYPDFAAAYFEKGAALLKTSDADKALENFVKAIQIKPDYVEAKYSYGYAEYLKKNYEVAAAVFDDVLKQRNDMPEAHMYLGISLYYLKNVEAAEAQLKMATASESGERVALAHRFLGGIYMQKKQSREAAIELQKYVDLVPKAPDADKLRATIADLKKQG